MVQSSPVTGLNAHEYRTAIEAAYYKAIMTLIKSGQIQFRKQELKLPDLELSDAEQTALQSMGSIHDSSLKTKIEREVRQGLLSYLQKTVAACQQQQFISEQANLAAERDSLGLSKQTTEQLSIAIRLEIYDQYLFTALQNSQFVLSPKYTQQLAQLQHRLDIADHQIPPAKKLYSEHGINYIRLWRYLNEENWKAANSETHYCLTHVSGKPSRDPQLIDIEQISSIDLQTIDSLWHEKSRGRFGFSAQHQIWNSAAVAQDPERFGREVGWRRLNSWISYEFVDFSLTAKPGHLPAFPHMGWWCWVGGMKALMARIQPQPMPSDVYHSN